jgi:MFS family permease
VSDAPATAPCRSVVSDLCSWRFAQLWLMIIMSATSGINIASSYKTFALKQPNLNSEAFLALVGSIAALGGNAAGRFFWGAMSDKFGFRRCFLTLTALQAFSKTAELAPGAPATQLVFELPLRAFLTTTASGARVLTGGNYSLFVSGHAPFDEKGLAASNVVSASVAIAAPKRA